MSATAKYPIRKRVDVGGKCESERFICCVLALTGLWLNERVSVCVACPFQSVSSLSSSPSQFFVAIVSLSLIGLFAFDFFSLDVSKESGMALNFSMSFRDIKTRKRESNIICPNEQHNRSKTLKTVSERSQSNRYVPRTFLMVTLSLCRYLH